MKAQIIEKEGRFYKECGVVMLETDKPSWLIEKAGQLHRPILRPLDRKDLLRASMANSNNFPQHLYIISDDEIKEGDWYLLGNQVRKAIANIGKPDDGKFLKIIATTDTSFNEIIERRNIFGERTQMDSVQEFSKPSDKFIQAYIDAYNKGEKIEKVLVEYELGKCSKESCDAFSCDANPLGCNYPEYLKPKLKDNNIIIKRVELTWEEIFEEFKMSPYGEWHKEFYSWVKKYYQVPKRKYHEN